MRITLHDSAEVSLIELCDTFNLSPSQMIKLLSTTINNHINKGQPLELQGVIYEQKEYTIQD